MKSTIISWLLIITLTAAGYFGGRLCVSQYLESKYPEEYRYETQGGLTPVAFDAYKAERNTFMLGLLISSSIIASGAVVASSKK